MGSLANKDFSLSTETMVWDLVWERPGWRGLYINGSTTSRRGLGRELWRPWLWGPERPVAPRQLGPWRFAATYCPPPPCPALSLHLPLHCWSVEASTKPALTLASMPRLSHVRTDLRVWSQRTRNTDSPPPSSPEMTRTVTKFAFTSVLRTVSSWQMPKYEEMHFWSLSPGIRVAFNQYQTW